MGNAEDWEARDATMRRLAALRRLYHHLYKGGRCTPDDERRHGVKMTKEALIAEIARLEAECE